MKICTIPATLTGIFHDLAKKVSEDNNKVAIIGSEEEAMVVMTFDKYQELVNKPQYTPYIPYTPYHPWWYTYTSFGPVSYTTSGTTLRTTGTSTVNLNEVSTGLSLSPAYSTGITDCQFKFDALKATWYDSDATEIEELS